MNTAVLVLMLLLLHAILSVVLLTFPKRSAVFYRFYLPSFLIAWIGYILYEGVYIPRNCTGECNIRVDLLLIYPWLLFVSICTLTYFVLNQRAGSGAKHGEGESAKRELSCCEKSSWVPEQDLGEAGASISCWEDAAVAERPGWLSSALRRELVGTSA